MPADTGDKTEAPTPRRLQEAREKGQVARSMDLSAAIGLLAGMLLLNWYGSTILQGFMAMTWQSLNLEEAPTNGWTVIDFAGRLFIKHGSAILLPFFLVLVVVAVVSNLAQVGFIFSGQPITPALSKLSPIKGVARLFSKRTAMRLLMSLTKVGVISV
ncbi:EscU/YscU/HrcU family type III secretion system export apparatus switch protein, partial [Planctomycetota bacterium]